MDEGNLSVKELADRLVEEVRGRGMAAATVAEYRWACGRIVGFAEASGDAGWSDGLLAGYLGHIDAREADGGMCRGYARFQRRVARLLASLAETGEADFSAAEAPPAKYPVDDQAAGVVEDILRAGGVGEASARDLRAPVRHLLWYAAERGVAPLEVDDALLMRFLVEEAPATNGGSAGRTLRGVRLAAEWLKANGGRVRHDYSMLRLRDGKRAVVPPFSEPEIRSVVESIDAGTAAGMRDRAIILLAYCTGLRCSDICGLKLSDVDWRAQRVSLVQSKTREPIACELNGETMNALADYVLEARPDCGAPEVFVTVNAPHRALSGSLGGMLDRRCAAAGVEKVPMRSFHSLRRSFETVMVSRGVPIETASQMMGHKSVDEDKPYVTHDRSAVARVAMGFGDVPITCGAYAAKGGGAS